jgi:hypothetical protein
MFCRNELPTAVVALAINGNDTDSLLIPIVVAVLGFLYLLFRTAVVASIPNSPPRHLYFTVRRGASETCCHTPSNSTICMMPAPCSLSSKLWNFDVLYFAQLSSLQSAATHRILYASPCQSISTTPFVGLGVDDVEPAAVPRAIPLTLGRILRIVVPVLLSESSCTLGSHQRS